MVLQDSLAKYVNSSWKYLTRRKIEHEGGINHAYKSKSGVFTALADLDGKMKEMTEDPNMVRPAILDPYSRSDTRDSGDSLDPTPGESSNSGFHQLFNRINDPHR